MIEFKYKCCFCCFLQSTFYYVVFGVLRQMLTSFLESILWCCFGSKFFDILLKSIVLVLFFVLESSVNPCRKQSLNEFESLLESTFYSCLKSNFVFVVLELCFCCFGIMFLVFLTSFLESSHRSHSSLCCFLFVLWSSFDFFFESTFYHVVFGVLS